MASPDKTPLFIEGIGPPLEQIREDYEALLPDIDLPSRIRLDVLALVAEVVRLQERLEREQRAADVESDMLTEERNEARRVVVRLQEDNARLASEAATADQDWKKAEERVVRLQEERDDYLRVVQAARLALDFLPATGQVSLPHRRGLEVVRAELRNALAALAASPDKPPTP